MQNNQELKKFFMSNSSTLNSIVKIVNLYREGEFTKNDVYEIFEQWGLQIEEE